MLNQISSFVFLLVIYYVRHIPISIFWGMFLVFFSHKLARFCHPRAGGDPDFSLSKNFFLDSRFRGNDKKIIFYVFIATLIFLSYALAFLILLSLPLAVLNYYIQASAEHLMVPIILFSHQKPAELFKNVKWNDFYFSFLLNKSFCSRNSVGVTRSIATIIQAVALASVIIGGIEVFNDYTSHINPDIFDFLFPENGAVMFWGGVAFLSLANFFPNFLIPAKKRIILYKRLVIADSLPKFFREYIISTSLFHPYFFLSPRGRRLAREKNILSKDLILLLKKTFIENKNLIPDEWLPK